MTLSHLETQCERTIKRRRHWTRQRKFGVVSRPLRFTFWFFRFRLEIWITDRNLRVATVFKACRQLLGDFTGSNMIQSCCQVGRNSSACWRKLTCTTTHYFTQPIPNPLSWYMHHLPDSFHRMEARLPRWGGWQSLGVLHFLVITASPFVVLTTPKSKSWRNSWRTKLAESWIFFGTTQGHRKAWAKLQG